jgi:hypothetical protein
MSAITITPPPAPVTPVTITQFARKLATIAQQQHDTYHAVDEKDPELAHQIQRYWADLGAAFPGVGAPWSAVFISWCVHQAGATAAEFHFSARHSTFVYYAIRNALQNAGVFRAYPITTYQPKVGDIIQNNRGSAAHTYAFAAKNAQYSSHSAIVVERGSDPKGQYVVTIGGNESDSIRQKIVRLNPAGFVLQRASAPFICVIQNLK